MIPASLYLWPSRPAYQSHRGVGAHGSLPAEQGVAGRGAAAGAHVGEPVGDTAAQPLKEIVRDTLEATGLEPRWLELEITESVAMRESDYIVGLLSRLKTLGVTLSIDDFGTEYSSLSRLKTLPVDRIKMDMQYVRGIDESEKDQAITKVIINLAKSLGLKVIAEGVETESQMNFLYQRMCDEVQGYYYYQPMPADEAGRCCAKTC